MLRRVNRATVCAVSITFAAALSDADSASQILRCCGNSVWTEFPQSVSANQFATFQSRVDEYVRMHRRVESPLPPLAVTADLDEVHRLMDALRARIRTERRERGQGDLFRPEIIARFSIRHADGES